MPTEYSIEKVTALTTLPDYENVEEIGRGVFSIVYVSTIINKHAEHW